MRQWTYLELKTKVRNDLGLSQEDFVSDPEMLGYCNEAINEAEKEIHTLYEDYFLRSTTYSIVTGTATYSLPSDIFANKIRGMVYNYNNSIYTIERIKEEDMFENIAIDDDVDAGTYRYIILNTDAATEPQFRLVPDGKANETDAITLWYLRNANRVTADTSVCDIPEFAEFVLQYMKHRCYEKEMHPNLSSAIMQLELNRKQMINTLTNMVPDDDNEIERDMTFYWETV